MKILFLFFIFVNTLILAQSKGHYQVTYSKYSNGILIGNQDRIVFQGDAEHSIISTENFILGQIDMPFEFSWFASIKTKNIHKVAVLNDSMSIATLDTISYQKQEFVYLDEVKQILGYNCQKAEIKINSNTITIWFTRELNVFGGPTTLGNYLGLILEYDRNGSFVIRADEVKHIKKKKLELPQETKNNTYYAALEYRDLVWKSRFITIPIFDKQQINFEPSVDKTEENGVFRFASGTLVAKKIKFPKITEGQHVFIEASIQSNGDAYDRTASVVAIPINKKKSMLNAFFNSLDQLPVFLSNDKKYQGVVSDSTYDTPIELMRLFTTFGLHHFNHIELKDKIWQTRVPYRQDITELSPVFSDQDVWIVMFIGNYDKGGHIADLHITIHPGETQFFVSRQVVPLFNTTNILEMAGQEYGTMFENESGLEMSFTLTKPIKNAYLRYISTGHGGWEKGDEFLPKPNSVFIDNKLIHKFIPWRQDCGSYRLFNPASGNFSNGLSSSDYSRSNWCPGMLTNPEYIFIGDLDEGQHTIRVTIPQGAKEGGSFSVWNVSALIFGE
jgi:GLPGLI family protein